MRQRWLRGDLKHRSAGLKARRRARGSDPSAASNPFGLKPQRSSSNQYAPHGQEELLYNGNGKLVRVHGRADIFQDLIVGLVGVCGVMLRIPHPLNVQGQVLPKVVLGGELVASTAVQGAMVHNLNCPSHNHA
eukprot:10635194-Alexandrium_andersonii.AAC.1